MSGEEPKCLGPGTLSGRGARSGSGRCCGDGALCEHLKLAWSGLWNERAIHNRAVLGITDEVGGGVLVQRMVWARVSGVLHTINLAGGQWREMVINVGLGIGEGIVSGAVAADQVIVSKDWDAPTGALRFRYIANDKRERVVFDRASGSGTRRVEITLEGHEPWSGTVDVVAGQKGRVEVRLKAIPVAKPEPTPEPVDTARVYSQADVDTPPKRRSGESPSYPRSGAPKLRSGDRVSVSVRFVVTETGEVQDVSVVESAGKAVDAVVVQAVKGWKYEPATKRGVKVRSQMLLKQTFLGG